MRTGSAPISSATTAKDTRHLDPRSLAALDYWIKCLEDEGIYIWLDLHYLREIKPADGVTVGRDEISRAKGIMWGFNYVNPQLISLMQEFQHQYLSHVNMHTQELALQGRSGDRRRAHHQRKRPDFPLRPAVLDRQEEPGPPEALRARDGSLSQSRRGSPTNQIWRSWEPGPSKYWLCELEHRFNRTMIDQLRSDGVKAPIATTNLWGQNTLFSLPPLTDGDVIDVHAYGTAEALSTDPHRSANFLTWAASARVHGKPLVMTEWNVPFPEVDRFTAPLYVASIAALQGWNASLDLQLFTGGAAGAGTRGGEASHRQVVNLL